LNGPVLDDFEGVGFLFEVFVALAAIAVVFPIITIVLKLREAYREQIPGGNYIWAFLSAYFVSLFSAGRLLPLSFTEHVGQTALLACSGTVSAIFSLIFALLARGSGRRPAVAGGLFLTLVWLPIFYGRVLLQF
jgi:hypothetical protein